jgi:uncharacterized glyoxalase superfamily protein PhnB
MKRTATSRSEIRATITFCEGKVLLRKLGFHMKKNRSIPFCTVIPELAYPDVAAAADWLCAAFGFTVRLRIANHRVQLNVGSDGAVVVTELRGNGGADFAHSVLVRVEDVHAHHDRAKAHGAEIIRSPQEYPYGERQYSAQDPGGHVWTFTQSIADVDPGDWGGEAVELA